MAFQFGTVVDRFIHKGALRWWRHAARHARQADPLTLRRYLSRARQLRTHLNEAIFAAEERLSAPGTTPTPFGTEWAWRPDLWRGPAPVPGLSSVQNASTLGTDLTVFHDCDHSELTVRQLRNQRDGDLAPFGLALDVFKFEGSFLSIVIELPDEAMNGLTKDHLIRVDTVVELEKPIEIFARLNVKNGPNVAQLVRELPLTDDTVMVEFDLAYSNMNQKRVEKAWLDVIFEGPEMNQVILRDLTVSRRLRASI